MITKETRLRCYGSATYVIECEKCYLVYMIKVTTVGAATLTEALTKALVAAERKKSQAEKDVRKNKWIPSSADRLKRHSKTVDELKRFITFAKSYKKGP